MVLHRRNAEDLHLSLQSRTEAVASGVGFLARLLGAALTDDALRERLQVGAEAIAWVSFLPARQRREFVVEFLRTAEAAAELGVMTQLAQLLHEWQATARDLRRPGAGGRAQATAHRR